MIIKKHKHIKKTKNNTSPFSNSYFCFRMNGHSPLFEQNAKENKTSNNTYVFCCFSDEGTLTFIKQAQNNKQTVLCVFRFLGFVFRMKGTCT